MIQALLQAKSSNDLHLVQEHMKYITKAGNLLDFGSEDNSTTSTEVLTVRIFLKSLGINPGSASSQA
jgi:hypothetical protein